MPKSKSNAAVAGGRMKVQPDHHSGFTDQERTAAQSGSARKPQLTEEIETVNVADFGPPDRASTEHEGDDEPTKAIVSRGRTVEAPVPGKRRLVGQTSDGVQIYGPVMNRYGPGETVVLERWEVRRLQELGFLVDPDKVEPAINDGKSGPRATAEQEGTHQYFFRSAQQ